MKNTTTIALVAATALISGSAAGIAHSAATHEPAPVVSVVTKTVPVSRPAPARTGDPSLVKRDALRVAEPKRMAEPTKRTVVNPAPARSAAKNVVPKAAPVDRKADPVARKVTSPSPVVKAAPVGRTPAPVARKVTDPSPVVKAAPAVGKTAPVTKAAPVVRKATNPRRAECLALAAQYPRVTCVKYGDPRLAGHDASTRYADGWIFIGDRVVPGARTTTRDLFVHELGHRALNAACIDPRTGNFWNACLKTFGVNPALINSAHDSNPLEVAAESIATCRYGLTTHTTVTRTVPCSAVNAGLSWRPAK